MQSRKRNTVLAWLVAVGIGLCHSAYAQSDADALPLAVPEFDYPSVMFPEKEINAFKTVLDSYLQEKRRQLRSDSGEVIEDDDSLEALLRKLETADKEEIPDVVLPDFFVSSIVYRNPSDWAVWINKEKLTSRAPESAQQKIKIQNISEYEVTFSWKPAELPSAFKRYRELVVNPLEQQEASEEEAQVPEGAVQEAAEEQSEEKADDANTEDETAAVRQVAKKESFHREAQSASMHFDEKDTQFIVTMRPNQTFAADVMRLFEGHYKTVRVRSTGAEEDKSALDKVGDTLDSLLSSEEKIKQPRYFKL